jgi:gentisate 1,2-dioxygenase
MGWDGDRPTRCLDALVHEIDRDDDHDPSALWDAILFMVEGSSGWTEVDGVRGTTGRRGTRFTFRMELASPWQRWRQAGPLREAIRRADALDARHEPHRGRRTGTIRQAAAARVSSGTPATIHGAACAHRQKQKAPLGPYPHPCDEQEILATPRGAPKFLNDRSIGNQASGSRR